MHTGNQPGAVLHCAQCWHALLCMQLHHAVLAAGLWLQGCAAPRAWNADSHRQSPHCITSMPQPGMLSLPSQNLPSCTIGSTVCQPWLSLQLPALHSGRCNPPPRSTFSFSCQAALFSFQKSEQHLQQPLLPQIKYLPDHQLD